MKDKLFSTGMNYTVGFGPQQDILVMFTEALIPMNNAHPLLWHYDTNGIYVPDYSRTMFWDVRDKEMYERPCTYGIHFPDKTFYIGRTNPPSIDFERISVQKQRLAKN